MVRAKRSAWRYPHLPYMSSHSSGGMAATRGAMAQRRSTLDAAASSLPRAESIAALRAWHPASPSRNVTRVVSERPAPIAAEPDLQ